MLKSANLYFKSCVYPSIAPVTNAKASMKETKGGGNGAMQLTLIQLSAPISKIQSTAEVTAFATVYTQYSVQ